jgi:small-conductance mechanosensitive channel
VGSFVVLLWVACLCVQAELDGAPIVQSAAYIATADAVDRLARSVAKGKAVPRVVAGVMVVGLVLHFAGVLAPVMTQLQGFTIPLGDIEINLWAIASGIVALLLLMWLANIRSAVLLGVWDRFQERGIEIPFPQRDVHIKELPLRLCYGGLEGAGGE